MIFSCHYLTTGNHMHKNLFIITAFFMCLGISATSSGEQNINAIRVSDPPVIDGKADDPEWHDAQQIITHDKASDLPVNIKAVYTDNQIFMLFKFHDQDESRTHKSWNWDTGRALYKVGHDREDVFVIKWSMETEPVDLSIYSDTPYLADLWFWKACRTDPVGYADDKVHLLSFSKERDTTDLTSRSGVKTYLTRIGDKGSSAYQIDLKYDYEGDVALRYINRQPSGSRADIKAKGSWNNGEWTIEFARALDTGNLDDILFKTDRKYLFGVSRYEIAGRPSNNKLTQPLYGTGDINEMLWLHFIK
jgi:hypothetical protein